MSISEAIRPTTLSGAQVLAWPVIGGKDALFGKSASVDEDVRALQGIGTKLRIPRNGTIFTRGDSADHAYKVVNGVVRLCKHMADGRRHIAQFSFPGDFFSVMELEKHSFTAEAVTDVVLMAYPQPAIASLCESRPTARRRFHTLLSHLLNAMENHLTVLGRQTSKERVVSFLLFLSERFGSEDDNLIDLPMSRQDIADYLGLTIETVCRVLSELKRAHLIKLPNLRQVILSDADALYSLAAARRDRIRTLATRRGIRGGNHEDHARWTDGMAQFWCLPVLAFSRRPRHRPVGQDETIAAPLEERDKPPAGPDSCCGVTA